MSGFVRVGRVLTPTVIASLEWSRWSRPQFDQHSRFDFWMRYAIGYGRTSYVQMVVNGQPTSYDVFSGLFQYGISVGLR